MKVSQMPASKLLFLYPHQSDKAIVIPEVHRPPQYNREDPDAFRKSRRGRSWLFDKQRMNTFR